MRSLPIILTALLASTAPARSADAPPDPSALANRLDRALSLREIPTGMKVEVGWRTASVFHHAALWGDGVGIWEGRRQFRLTKEDLLRVLSVFAESRFEAMSSEVADEEEEGEPERDQGIRLRWRFHLELDGAAKTVVRTTQQPRRAEVERLGLVLIGLCEEASKKGIEAKDIEDALAKLKKGALAPVALTLSFATLEERADAAGARPGWRLLVRGLDYELSRFGTDAEAAPARGRLAGADFDDLVKALIKADPGRFPQTLVSDRYEQLSIDALGHAKDLQARAFAGLTRGSAPKAQKAYEKLRATLAALKDRLAARS